MDILVNDLVLKLGCALDQSEYVLANKDEMGVKTKEELLINFFISSSDIMALILSLVLEKGIFGRMFSQSSSGKAGRRLRPTDLLNLMTLLCLSCPWFNS